MGLRPGKCYRSVGKRPYTRTAVTVHRRNYIGATPGLKIRQFNMGAGGRRYSHIVDLVVEESVQIRDNALESARIAINRYLVKHLGKDTFFMKIRVYPHNILRENKQAQGAHADRIQQGMSHPFGKPIGRCARVRAGQAIISVLVRKEDVKTAKNAVLRAKSRFPCTVHAKAHEDIESIGTRSTKVIEDVVIEEEPKEEEEGKEKTEGEEEDKEGEEKEGEGKEGEKKEEGDGKGKEEKGDWEKGKEGKKEEKKK